MAIPLKNMRELLLPGLHDVTMRYIFKMNNWAGTFGKFEYECQPETMNIHADPNFTLDELTEAQDLIESLRK